MFGDTHKKTKHFLFILIVVVFLIFAVSAAMYVYFYSKSIAPSSYRSFSVSGEGKIIAVPDIATFGFSVITEGGKDIAKLQSDNTGKVNKIIEFLKTNEIDEKDIKTEIYNLSPRYQYYRCVSGEICPPAEIVGYTINQSVSVKVRDFDKIGALLSGVVENGANSVSQLSFTIDDSTEVQNEARAEAIKKAQDKAKAIAEAGGFNLGRLLSIQEGSAPDGFYGYAPESMALGMGGGGEPPSIEPGSQEVSVNVTLTYEIR